MINNSLGWFPIHTRNDEEGNDIYIPYAHPKWHLESFITSITQFRRPSLSWDEALAFSYTNITSSACIPTPTIYIMYPRRLQTLARKLNTSFNPAFISLSCLLHFRPTWTRKWSRYEMGGARGARNELSWRHSGPGMFLSCSGTR